MESSPAKALIFLGAILIVVGLVWMFAGKFLHFGKLPGDLSMERENFRFHFPLATSLIISLILTILLNLAIRLFRK